MRRPLSRPMPPSGALRHASSLVVALLLSLSACGAKGPPRAPGAAAPPEELAQPQTSEPDCVDCLVTEPQPGLVSDPATEPPATEGGESPPEPAR